MVRTDDAQKFIVHRYGMCIAKLGSKANALSALLFAAKPAQTESVLRAAVEEAFEELADIGLDEVLDYKEVQQEVKNPANNEQEITDMRRNKFQAVPGTLLHKNPTEPKLPTLVDCPNSCGGWAIAAEVTSSGHECRSCGHKIW